MTKSESDHSHSVHHLPRKRTKLSRGIFIIPSLLTAAALCSGFYSIINTLHSVLPASIIPSTHDQLRNAVLGIIAASLFDSLDGRMARLMRAESEFGSHFDSIADVVSFGVAPAVLVYASALVHLGRWGWVGAFLFLACAAIRLARFNVLAQQGGPKKYFKGLSSPMAAAGASLFAYLLRQYIDGRTYYLCVFGMTIFLALLMVSNVRFRSFKDLDFKRYQLQVFLLAVLMIVMVVAWEEMALFLFFSIYTIAGLIEELILFRRRRKSDPSVPFLPFGDREP